MLPDMILGSYLPGQSLLHRADPRTKLLLLTGLLVLALTLRHWPALLALWMFVLWVGKESGQPFGRALRGLRPVLWLALFAVLLQLWRHGGAMGGERLAELTRPVLRLTLLASATALLTATTQPLALTDGLARLFKPLQRIGVPVNELALLLALALRFLPETFEEAGRLWRVQSCRGAAPQQSGALQRVRSTLPLLIPLMAGALRRGEALAQAMDARCYRGGNVRSRLKPLSFSRADFGCATAMIALVAVVALLEQTLA